MKHTWHLNLLHAEKAVECLHFALYKTFFTVLTITLFVFLKKRVGTLVIADTNAFKSVVLLNSGTKWTYSEGLFSIRPGTTGVVGMATVIF